MQYAIDLLIYLIYYFALLQLSSVAICGWYATTRGYKITQPDGKEKKSGKLLKAWYFFWHMEYPQKIETEYKGKQLQILINKMQPAANGVPMWITEESDSKFLASDLFYKFQAKLEAMFDLKFVVVTLPPSATSDLKLEIRVFEVEPHYVFPEWIRDMMAGCITCHASFYGSIIFWLLYLGVWDDIWLCVYSPFENHWFGVIFTWLAYTFSLAYLNTVKYRKI